MTDLYIAFDIGYAYTKAISSDRPMFMCPSLVGKPDHGWSLGESSTITIQIGDKEYFVGDSALVGSRFTERSEDRDWVHTPEYMALVHTALSQSTGITVANVFAVTGLPTAFYKEKEYLEGFEQTLKGEHIIRRKGRPPQTMMIENLIVVPQGIGVAIDVALSDDALTVRNEEAANGNVGIIDVGGKTTNFQRVNQMNEVSPETDSISIGSWDAVREIRPTIYTLTKGAEYEDHEIAKALAVGSIKFRGKPISIAERTQEIAKDFAGSIVSRANQAWDGGAKLDAIIIAGGGSSVFGEAIKSQLEHDNITVVDDPQFSNVRGYYKLALRAKQRGL